MTKEGAAIIREELKGEQGKDYITEYLKSIDTELDNIDKRMRFMMKGVNQHSQSLRDQSIQESLRKTAEAQLIKDSAQSKVNVKQASKISLFSQTGKRWP